MKMYRDYKTFNINSFRKDFEGCLNSHITNDYSYFQKVFLKVLNKCAPIMKNVLNFNNNSLMSKALRKIIMHSSKLKSTYDKWRTEDNWSDYKNRRNSCVSLFCKTKAKCFHKLNVKDLSDSKRFWKTKSQNWFITEEKELATVMKIFFVKIIEGLDKKRSNDLLNPINYQNINNVLEKFKNHPSVRKIRQTFMTDEKLSFKIVAKDIVRKNL